MPISETDISVSGLSLQDVNDGPRCLEFAIVQASADNVFKVEAAFELCRTQCDAADSTGSGSRAVKNTSGVLSNRWSSTDSIDVNLRTTRIYHGQLEIASSKFSPHWFREIVVPPLQNGFRREKMDFTASEDGKVLAYTIADISVACSAPYPAQTWAVQQTTASLFGDAMKCTSQVSVSLTGTEDCDKAELVQLAMYILTAKIQGSIPGAAAAGPQNIFWNDITITDFTGDVNRIDASASAWVPMQEFKGAAGVAGKGLLINATGIAEILTSENIPPFGTNPEYDPTISAGGYPDQAPIYQGPRSLIGIFGCYLQVPCSTGNHQINIGTNQLGFDYNDYIAGLMTSQPLNAPQIPVSAVIVPSISTTVPAVFSASQQALAYTHWQMQSSYDTNSLRAACPIALGAYTGSGPDTRTTTANVQLAAYQARRVARIRAERIGDYPEFPDPDLMDSGIASLGSSPLPPIMQKFLKKKLLAQTKVTSVTGQDLYVAEWQVVFSLSRAPTPNDYMKVGMNKWQQDGGTGTNATLISSPQQASSNDNNLAYPGGGSYS